MKLTKKVLDQYQVEFDSQFVDFPLGKSFTIYTVQSYPLKVNWSGVGSEWLKKAKRDLAKVIECS